MENEENFNTDFYNHKNYQNKRNITPLHIFTFILLVVVLVILLVLPFSKETSKPTNFTNKGDIEVNASKIVSAQVDSVEGSVWKVISGNTEPLSKGMKISEGTEIKTNENGKITIQINNDYLKLENNSIARIDKLTENEISIYQEKGRIFIDKNTQTGIVRVYTGNVIVEGYKARFTIDRDLEVKVVVLEDEVKVISGTTETLLTANQEWMESRPLAVNLNSNTLFLNDQFYDWKSDRDLSSDTEIVMSNKENQDGLEETSSERAIGGNSSTVNINATKANPSTVSLNWIANNPTNDGYLVNWSKAGGGTFSAYLSHPGSNSFDVGQLEPGQNYTFSVCIVFKGNCIAGSNSISVTM